MPGVWDQAVIRERLFPELLRFPAEGKRAVAWKRAADNVTSGTRFLLLMLAALGVYAIIVFSLPALGVPMAHRGTIRGIFGAGFMALPSTLC